MASLLSGFPKKSPSSLSLFLGIWAHISHHRRIQLVFLLVVMLSSGLAELVSLGAVLPFLAVLSNPEQIWDQPYVREFANSIGYFQSEQLILPITLLFAVSVFLASFVRLTNLWMNSRLAAAIGSDLSCKAYTCILYQPYELHLQRNTSEVITGIAAQITRSVAAITSFLQLITACSIAFSWFVGLLLVDWKVALGAFWLFGSAYALLAIRIRRELRSNSHLIASNLKKQVQALQEGLGAIRDVILDRNQQTYVDVYRKADRLHDGLKLKSVSQNLSTLFNRSLRLNCHRIIRRCFGYSARIRFFCNTIAWCCCLLPKTFACFTAYVRELGGYKS